LIPLRDAALYISDLPKAVHDTEESQAAMQNVGRHSSLMPTVTAIWSVVGTAPMGGPGPSRIVPTVARCVMAAAVIVTAAPSFRRSDKNSKHHRNEYNYCLHDRLPMSVYL
jgi:hypothetical protein